MITTIEGNDGEVTIRESSGGRRSLTVVPKEPGTFVFTETCQTTYPIDLIKMIFEINGVRGLCHTIVRDEDPNYVQRLLQNDLFAYFTPGDFEGKQILDFGCGSGASSMILARMFPTANITGVELSPSSLAVARKVGEFYGLPNVRFLQSPSGTELPLDLGKFDFVILSAVFEHLLPNERLPVMSGLWRAVRDGGHLFLNQTPNRLFPIELHTTMLPFINYVPDAVAFWMARRFSKRVTNDVSWEHLLREGIRGGTEKEIRAALAPDDTTPVLLQPRNNGLRDRIDLYYLNTDPIRLRTAKTIAKVVIKGIRGMFGVTIIPDLSLAFHKPATGIGGQTAARL